MSASRNTKNKSKNIKKYNEYRVALTEFIANPSKDTLAALRKIEYTQGPCCPKKSYDADSDPTANCERCLIRQPINNLESMCLLCYIDDTEIGKDGDPVAAALVAALMLQPIFEGNDAEPREKEA